MSKYILPQLPYAYDALEPHISRRVLELHHDKHHAGYVANANRVLEQFEDARKREDFERLTSLERALAFNVSGHVLHSLFWTNLSPKGGGQPDGVLGDALKRDFGSFEGFRAQFTQVAKTLMGSGWAALIWEPLSSKLLITQIYDHQSNLSQASVPLMVLDAWEHAYYLQYENRKDEFFNAVWNLWDWKDIGRRYEAAKKVAAI